MLSAECCPPLWSEYGRVKCASQCEAAECRVFWDRIAFYSVKAGKL